MQDTGFARDAGSPTLLSLYKGGGELQYVAATFPLGPGQELVWEKRRFDLESFFRTMKGALLGAVCAAHGPGGRSLFCS